MSRASNSWRPACARSSAEIYAAQAVCGCPQGPAVTCCPSRLSLSLSVHAALGLRRPLRPLRLRARR